MTAVIIGGAFAIIAAVLGGVIAAGQLDLSAIRRRKRLPREYVILISGASGVGKTTIACALARRYAVTSVFGTDMLREALRGTLDGERAALINVSTFLAHRVTDPTSDGSDPRKVVDGFRQQCDVLAQALIRVINRSRSAREPVILEGANLCATQLFAQLPSDPMNRILFINLYLDDRKEHVARLRQRADEKGDLPEKADKYVKCINEIGAINEFLRADAAEANKTSQFNIISVENAGTVKAAVARIESEISRRVESLRVARR